jgi:RHS repeat-associated protein
MTYDAFGNRVSKTVNGVTTQYLVEDDVNPTGLPQVLEEIVGGSVQRVYTYGLQRISQSLSPIVTGSNAWTPSFYGYDGGASVRQLTNSAGAVTDSYDYDAFGNVVHQTGSTPNNYRYRGEQWDPDLSLYYLRARYYNPVTDRFLTRDPKPGRIGIPHSLHKYLYASADAVNRIDPRGKEDLIEMGNEEDTAPASEPGLKAVANRINCIYGTVSSMLDAINAIQSGDIFGSGFALVGVAYSFESCSAEAEGKKPESCPLCFAAGTPIHTDHGDVAIEKVEVGDEVVSRDSSTGKLENEPVTALTPQHTDSLLEVRIEGERTPLRPSTHHPFWTKRGDSMPRWINSGEMRVGDFVQSLQGNWRRVVSITPVAGQETVYNFTVDKDHDYFVGDIGYLVHNAGGCGCQLHHNWPKYLGGPKKGPLTPLNPAYHQRITNLFRQLRPYGLPTVDPTTAQQIIDQVYEELPLDSPEGACPE